MIFTESAVHEEPALLGVVERPITRRHRRRPADSGDLIGYTTWRDTIEAAPSSASPGSLPMAGSCLRVLAGLAYRIPALRPGRRSQGQNR